MNRHKILPPLIELSIVDILYIYINIGLIVEPKIFGLKSFSFDELACNGFHMEGDISFCLFEKEYRLLGVGGFVNVKIYFLDGDFFSNGFDFESGRLISQFSCFKKEYDLSQASCIRSVDFLLDDGCDCGSLIINGYLDVRFRRRGGRRERFKICGISTDVVFEGGELRSGGNVKFARAMKGAVSVYDANKRFESDLGIKELANFLIREYPNAIT